MQLCSWSSPCWLSFTQNEVFSLLFQSDFWEVLSAGRGGAHGVSGIFYRQEGSKRAYLPWTKEGASSRSPAWHIFPWSALTGSKQDWETGMWQCLGIFKITWGKITPWKKQTILLQSQKGSFTLSIFKPLHPHFMLRKFAICYVDKQSKFYFENCSGYIRMENRKCFC